MPLVRVGRATLVPGALRLVAGASLLVACASTSPGEKATEPTTADHLAEALKKGPPAGYRPGQGPPGETGGGGGVKIEQEIGYLSQENAEDPILARFSDFTGCYRRAGDAQRYAGGRVLLRFVIGRDGRPLDVLVIETRLGSFEVERCLVEVGRSLQFARPEGDRPTNFDYPIEFRSTAEVAVVDRPAERIDKAWTTQLPRLGACGCAGTDLVKATLYVQPGGHVGSVGLASDAALDASAAACTIGELKQWSLPGELGRAVSRVVVPVAPVGCPGALP